MSENVISNINSPTLETSTADFIRRLTAQGSPPLCNLSVAEARGVLSGAQAGDVEKLPIEIDDRIIPGHKPIGNRAQLKEFRYMLVAVRENVARLKKQGESLAEVIAAKSTAAYDAKWGDFVIDPTFFTRLVHEGL